MDAAAGAAITISIMSLLIALGSLAWNIWSKFIYPKPRFRVRFSVVERFDLETDGPVLNALRISATNHGPIESVIESAVLLLPKKSWRSKPRHGIPKLLVSPFYSDEAEFNAGLPRTVKVGESISLFMHYGPECVLRRGILKVGMQDGFARNHWAAKKDLAAAAAGYWKQYPAQGEKGVAVKGRTRPPSGQ